MATSLPFSPRDLIHSAASPPEEPSELSKSRKFSIFSPRHHDLRQTSLRRLFSPRRRNPPQQPSVADDQAQAEEETTDHSELQPAHRESSDSSLVPTSHGNHARTSRRRRPLLFPRGCACFSPPPNLDDVASDLDFGQHLKTLKPTYVPQSPLLPPGTGDDNQERICLVLDLDETLVHSSFTPIEGADFEIPLEMQGEVHTVFVKKRPGVDDFLQKVSQWYEIVIFTASLALYANPVMDLLDPHKLVQLRLYREHCVLIGGCYVKDIAKLGRDLKRTFIIDNSPLSYVLQPENAIPITAFFTDENDRELEKTLALLEQAKNMKDVRKAFS